MDFSDDFPVFQNDLALPLPSNVGIMGDDQQGGALPMQLRKEVDNDVFVCLVEVSGRFVGQDDGGVVDEGTSHAHALLLPSRQFMREVGGASGHAHPV